MKGRYQSPCVTSMPWKLTIHVDRSSCEFLWAPLVHFTPESLGQNFKPYPSGPAKEGQQRPRPDDVQKQWSCVYGPHLVVCRNYESVVEYLGGLGEPIVLMVQVAVEGRLAIRYHQPSRAHYEVSWTSLRDVLLHMPRVGRHLNKGCCVHMVRLSSGLQVCKQCC